MYIKSLHIQDFKCFGLQEIEFQYPGRTAKVGHNRRLSNVNLLLGDNGSGKSSVLKAIAIAVLGEVLSSSGFRSYYNVRQTLTDKRPTIECELISEIVLHFQDGNGLEPVQILEGAPPVKERQRVRTTIRRMSPTTEAIDSLARPARSSIYNEHSLAYFLIGYGSTRRADSAAIFDPGERDRQRNRRYQRVATLFEDYVPLTPVNAWRLEMPTKSQAECVSILNDLLPDIVRVTIESLFNDEAIFLVAGVPLTFAALSDGYRAFISWIGDLLYHMHQVAPMYPFRDIRGVVMVDELDLLLHPEWQRTVVESLATTFPNLQFIFTTHSPVVAGTVEAANILLTDFDEETGTATVTPGHEKIFGRSADQILTSPYFGLATPRAPGAADDMRDLAHRAWAGDESASLEFLKKLTDGFEPAEPAASESSTRPRAKAPRKSRAKVVTDT